MNPAQPPMQQNIDLIKFDEVEIIKDNRPINNGQNKNINNVENLHAEKKPSLEKIIEEGSKIIEEGSDIDKNDEEEKIKKKLKELKYSLTFLEDGDGEEDESILNESSYISRNNTRFISEIKDALKELNNLKRKDREKEKERRERERKEKEKEREKKEREKKEKEKKEREKKEREKEKEKVINNNI